MSQSILECPICGRLPQKSSSDTLPAGAELLVDGPGETKRCPDCQTFYYYSYDYDRGEPMVPSSETYTLSRLTPVLARAQLQGAPEHERLAAQPLIEALAQDWEPTHAALAAAADGALPASPHIVKHIVESLSDYYLENDDKGAFSRTLLASRHAAVRANAGTDFLYVATEEHAVWTVRAFSRHQQKLAAEWLKDETFGQEILQALASCLCSDEPTVLLDAVLGNRDRHACVTAYFGLMNAFYRHFDPTPVIPALLATLVSPERGWREIAASLLEDASKEHPAVKPAIRQALTRHVGEISPEMSRVLKAAGARRRRRGTA